MTVVCSGNATGRSSPRRITSSIQPSGIVGVSELRRASRLAASLAATQRRVLLVDLNPEAFEVMRERLAAYEPETIEVG